MRAARIRTKIILSMRFGFVLLTQLMELQKKKAMLYISDVSKSFPPHFFSIKSLGRSVKQQVKKIPN